MLIFLLAGFTGCVSFAYNVKVESPGPEGSSLINFVCIDTGLDILFANICNGITDRQDFSDETKILCRFIVCSYEACIWQDLNCDGIQNCVKDISDQTLLLCDVVEICTNSEFQCVIPSECIPVKDLCNGYIDNRHDDSNEDVTSRITCPALKANGAIRRCEMKWGPHEGWISCDNFVPVGTQAFLECPEYYERVNGTFNATCLEDGTWSEEALHCKPSCGNRGSSILPLIVNGWESSKTDPLPWHAILFSYEDGKLNFFCGGTLIAERLVLTAGHCVWENDKDLLKVVLGGYSSDFNTQNEDAQIFNVEKIQLQYSYQDSDGNYGSDLAIIVLDKPAIINSIVRPACIDWNNDNDVLHRNGAIGLVSGMGITENDTFSSTLRITSAQIVTDDKCREKQKKDFRKYITYTSFCAGWGNGTGVCNGDSGGGLVLLKPNSTLWEVHGVVSISPRRLGTSFCDPNFYTIFTKVSAYATWIKEFVESVPVVGPPNLSNLPNHDTIG